MRYDPDDPGDSALLLFSGAEPGFWTSLVSVPVGLGFAWLGLNFLRNGHRNARAKPQ